MTSSKHVTIAVSGSNPCARSLVNSLRKKYQVIEIIEDSGSASEYQDSGENSTLRLLNFCDFGYAVHLRLLAHGTIQERFCDLLISIGEGICSVKTLLGYDESQIEEKPPYRQGATSTDYRHVHSFGRVIVNAAHENSDNFLRWIEDSIAALPSSSHYGSRLSISGANKS